MYRDLLSGIIGQVQVIAPARCGSAGRIQVTRRPKKRREVKYARQDLNL